MAPKKKVMTPAKKKPAVKKAVAAKKKPAGKKKPFALKGKSPEAKQFVEGPAYTEAEKVKYTPMSAQEKASEIVKSYNDAKEIADIVQAELGCPNITDWKVDNMSVYGLDRLGRVYKWDTTAGNWKPHKEGV